MIGPILYLSGPSAVTAIVGFVCSKIIAVCLYGVAFKNCLIECPGPGLSVLVKAQVFH